MDSVYDFTLCNPDPVLPESVKNTLKNIILEDKPGIHRYMSNAGYEDVRKKVADHVNRETGLNLSPRHVLMTCGAAGGLNVVLKTILNPSDEVIILAPYFSEYLFYVDNHGGIPVIVPSVKDTFEPDIEELGKRISEKTKAIIINSPNNPSGRVYNEDLLKKIAGILMSKEKEYNTTICVISDEPYTKIVYDGVKIPSILKLFKNSFVVNSFSKSLSLPGERIGYIAVNPNMEKMELLLDSLVFCNRTLGYVNAPALFQRAIAGALDEVVDVELYKV